MTGRVFRVLALTLAALAPSSAWAIVLNSRLAYEPFSYSGSMTGSTATNSTGFTGTFRTQVNTGNAVSPSLSYTDGAATTLGTIGNRFDIDQGRLLEDLNTAGGGPFAALLDGSGNIGLDGTTIYVGVLLKNTGGSDDFSALEFHRDSDLDPSIRTTIDMSRPNHGNATDFFLSNWQASGGGAVLQQADSLIAGNANVNLFVMRFDFGAANADTVRAYANPLIAGSEPVTPDGILNATDLSFDRLAFTNFGAGGTWQVDEIRLGTTFTSVVPEPSSVLLLGLGGAATVIAGRRVRRSVVR